MGRANARRVCAILQVFLQRGFGARTLGAVLEGVQEATVSHVGALR